ncbi:MAG: matrixin family metalloprotease [Candidatus Obscuribacterales bacterium]|nr:matrixin family metalloprotease [Candidatus Obscuribacterales bacterium]
MKLLPESKLLLLALSAALSLCPSVAASEEQQKLIPTAAASDYADSLGAKADYWHPEKMPIRVMIVADPRVPNYKPQFRDFFIGACQSWSEASNGKITFKFVQAEPCDIKVWWTNDLKQLLNKGELGEAQWENDPDGMYRANIKLLTLNEDGSRGINDQEAKLMCLHELGHALGIVKHSPYLGDIMNACIDFNYSTPLDQLILSPRDKATILRLYTEGDALLDKLCAESADPRARLMRLCFRADKLVQNEKYEQAYPLLDTALSIDPRCTPALSSMSNCCFEQGMDAYSAGNYELAVSRLSRFIETSKALNYMNNPQIAEAMESLNRCKAKLNQSKSK